MMNALHTVIRRTHYPKDEASLRALVRRLPAQGSPYRKMMQERGLFIDHATVYYWAIKIPPALAKLFRLRKWLVRASRRMDGAYMKVLGQWEYLCQTPSRPGCGLGGERAIGRPSMPETIINDKSSDNIAASGAFNQDSGTKRRQIKYLNNNS